MVRTSPLHGENSGSIPGSASMAGWSSGMILALGKNFKYASGPGFDSRTGPKGDVVQLVE